MIVKRAMQISDKTETGKFFKIVQFVCQSYGEAVNIIS